MKAALQRSMKLENGSFSISSSNRDTSNMSKHNPVRNKKSKNTIKTIETASKRHRFIVIN